MQCRIQGKEKKGVHPYEPLGEWPRDFSPKLKPLLGEFFDSSAPNFRFKKARLRCGVTVCLSQSSQRHMPHGIHGWSLHDTNIDPNSLFPAWIVETDPRYAFLYFVWLFLTWGGGSSVTACGSLSCWAAIQRGATRRLRQASARCFRRGMK